MRIATKLAALLSNPGGGTDGAWAAMDRDIDELEGHGWTLKAACEMMRCEVHDGDGTT